MKTLVLLLLLVGIQTSALWAQGCSVCTKTAEGLGASSAESLNTGILYLAAIPTLFACTVGYIWYRKSKR